MSTDCGQGKTIKHLEKCLYFVGHVGGQCFTLAFFCKLRLKCDGTRAETQILSFGETDENI